LYFIFFVFSGLIEDEAVFDENMDWSVYWRHMFKKVTPEDIEAFLAKYTGLKTSF
jgi:hypothetical protein